MTLLAEYAELLGAYDRVISDRRTYQLWVLLAWAMGILWDRMTERERQEAGKLQWQAYARRIA